MFQRPEKERPRNLGDLEKMALDQMVVCQQQPKGVSELLTASCSNLRGYSVTFRYLTGARQSKC